MTTDTLDQKKEITHSSKLFFSGTLLSRVLGLTRDIAMAWAFGSHAALAALMVAFRLSNLLRRLFGEGALHAAFVPVYEGIRAHSSQEASLFFQDLSALIIFFLIGVVLCGEGALVYTLHTYPLSSGNRQILLLMTLFLPSVVFICHAAFCSSWLQCHRFFLMPSLAPTFFNLFWIAGVCVTFSMKIEQAMLFLAGFILTGLLAQWIALFSKTRAQLKAQSNASFQWNIRRSWGHFKKVGRPLLLGILGVSATQINSALDALFARSASLKGPAYLWYAIRIEQVPLAIFGVALAGALLPTLTRAYLESREKFQELLDFALVRSLGLLIPCTTALLFIGPAALNLIFGRGQFDPSTALETSYCLWGYSSGLVFQGLCLILASAFYARQDYRTTTQATCLAMLLNIVLNFTFTQFLGWGAWSIALATSCSALFQTLLLTLKLIKGESFFFIKTRQALFKITTICLISGLFMMMTIGLYNPEMIQEFLLVFPRSFSAQLSNFCFQTIFFLTALFSLAWLFKVSSILNLLHYLPFVKIQKE